MARIVGTTKSATRRPYPRRRDRKVEGGEAGEPSSEAVGLETATAGHRLLWKIVLGAALRAGAPARVMWIGFDGRAEPREPGQRQV